ncbi:hypothetical protein EDB84DRAFT_1435926 [Lactarius hengduanensis]|nr:hypothetical protein EDB84DRAFT_1435926 [Lactarius hengduanensis]
MWLASFSPSPLLPLLPPSLRQTACVGTRIVILAFTAATIVVSGQFAALSPSSLLLPRLRCRHDLGCTLTVVCLGSGVVVMSVGDRITCRAPPSSSMVAIAGDTRGRAIAAVRTTRGLYSSSSSASQGVGTRIGGARSYHVIGVVVVVGRVVELTATIARDSKKSANTPTPTKALML